MWEMYFNLIRNLSSFGDGCYSVSKLSNINDIETITSEARGLNGKVWIHDKIIQNSKIKTKTFKF